MPSYQITKLKFQPPLTAAANVTLRYRYYLDESWIIIATELLVASDGTLSSPQTISGLDYNKRYTIEAICTQCDTIYKEDIYLPCTQDCPDGFTLAPDGSYCYKIETVAATPPSGSPDTLIAKTGDAYTTCGSYIYDAGYNSNGTGTSTQISTANAFWCNGGTCADNNLTDGVMNRAAVWTTTESDNQDIGFSVCINITEAKTYYIGIGCDNYGIIKIDGVTIIQQDETAIDTQYSIVGACFKVFHIYPVNLTAGFHYLELFGHNVTSIAAVAIEVYNNTSSEIAAATDYTDLNLIFSTKDEVGNPALLGTDGYHCPSGYSVAACESPVVCKKITTTDALCS